SGDLDLQAVVSALIETNYSGIASVELSRDSHRGSLAAEQALGELRTAIEISA
ncbi:MAG: sugar phosphate isomerase/epimerase, partial [Candidatus Paceibacteria bacterium]